MGEGKLPRVKRQAFGADFAVHSVAQDGMADFCKLYANLIFSPRNQFRTDGGPIGSACNNAIARLGEFAFAGIVYGKNAVGLVKINKQWLIKTIISL